MIAAAKRWQSAVGLMTGSSHRETVAGDANSRPAVSNMKFTPGPNWMRSPLGSVSSLRRARAFQGRLRTKTKGTAAALRTRRRHHTPRRRTETGRQHIGGPPRLLSSSTLLRLSIHSGSTSPSATTQDAAPGGARAACKKSECVCEEEGLYQKGPPTLLQGSPSAMESITGSGHEGKEEQRASRAAAVSTPSAHSRVSRLRAPSSCARGSAFGLSLFGCVRVCVCVVCAFVSRE